MPRPKTADRATVRTERMSLALPVSSYAGIKTLADIQGLSVNDLLNNVIRRLVEQNADVIGKFEADRARAADALNLNVDAPRADSTRIIDMPLYNTFMLWAEKISNGQHDAVYPFIAKLKETFAFDADKAEIIHAITTEDLNGARRYLSRIKFVVKDDAGYSYKLVATANGEYVLSDIPAAAMQVFQD